MRLNRTHKRPLEFSRGPADRDPMFAPIWYDGLELTVTPPTAPVEVPGPTWDLAPLPPPDTQQNNHVMRYWNWRWYDGLELTVTPPTEPAPDVPSPQWDLAPLPPLAMQQNDHVMRYWNWRLDRMGAKRDG